MIRGGWVLICAGLAMGQTARLDFSDKLRLVDCSPSSSVPCFRVKANIVDAQGNPVSPNLPTTTQLNKSLTIQTDNFELTPFYATAGAGPGQAVQSRIALVVIDISGSMNELMQNGQSRYAAARVAAELRARRLIYLSDVPGLLADVKDPGSLISTVKISQVDGLKKSGVIDKAALWRHYFEILDRNLAKLIVRSPEQALAAQTVLQAAGVATGRTPEAAPPPAF